MRAQLQAMKEPISSSSNPTFHNLKRPAADILSETKRVRDNAIKAMAEKKKKFYKQRIEDTEQDLKEDLRRIKKFPEGVGDAQKTKARLVTMRQTIYDHQIKLDMEEHRLNCGGLSVEIVKQRRLEVEEAEKRRAEKEGEMDDEKWAKRLSKGSKK